MMAEVYPLAQAVADDVAPVLLETRITYERPLRLQDQVVGRIWAAGRTGARWHIGAEFRVGGTVHARASRPACSCGFPRESRSLPRKSSSSTASTRVEGATA